MTRRSRPRIGARSVLAVTVLSLLFAGCGIEDGTARWTTAVDTLPGGAVHVVNTPPADPRPTFTIEEELRIGSIDEAGPATFGRLKGLVVTEEGRIAVLDDQAQEVRVFGADGRHLATHGGKGGGPGEFEAAFGLMRGPEGRLWVPDHRNARMSVLHATEGLEESFPFRVWSRAFVWRGSMGEDGRIFKPSVTIEEPREQFLRVYRPDMTLLDSLPVPQPPEADPKNTPWSFYWESSDGGARAFFGVPFYPRPQQAFDGRGRVWSTVFGDPSYRIKRWTPGGDTSLVVETLRSPVPVTQEERDSVVESLRERLPEGARTDWSKIPEVKPAVTAIFLAEDGDVWVEVSTAGEGHVFDVYEPDGRYRHTVETSLSLLGWFPPVIRGDRFWAVVTDELDVPYVVRGRIVPVDAT